jgi:RHS repeat-associated protein
MAKPPATSPEAVSLPSGGAAFKPIDEMFKSDLSTGSGFYQVPLSLPKGVNNLTPSIMLSYSSGQGNGHFGMGWAIHLPRIVRSTKKGIPGFAEDDLFMFDSRELVAVGGGLYQPEVESEFLQIRKNNDDDSWQVRTKNGLTMFLGSSDNSRMQFEENKTVQWLLDAMEDGNGVRITYEYLKDGADAYIKNISYGIYRLEFLYENREDAYSDFRSGHEVRTTLRCKSIDLFLLKPSIQPIKSYRLKYEQAKYSRISLLKEVRLLALSKATDGSTEEIPLSPITFSYTEFDPLRSRCETFEDSGSPPPFLLDRDVTLMDFEGNGRPGVIEIKNRVARFWANNGGLVWSSPRVIDDLPVRDDLGSANMIFADIDGNGTADLLVGGPQQQHAGFFPSIPGGGWDAMVRYSQSPSFTLNEPGTRLFDLNGDSKIDILHADRRAFYYYINNGRKGWAQYPVVEKRKRDQEIWPNVDLADSHVRLADIVGDGRSHIVQIHSRRVVFWPNLGNGRWGSQRRLKNAPVLPRNYDPNRLFLADIDGDGLADIMYVDYDRISCWINQSGQSFSEPVVIKGTPPVANTAILIADMKGSGTNGVLWSYPDALRRKTAYRYLDLAGGKKPYLLNQIRNNTGIVTDVLYGTSTEFEPDDDPRLKEKRFFLPFPVHVVKEIKVRDDSRKIQGRTAFRYVGGNYDFSHRRFLGFAKAERIEHGDETEPSTRFVSYFHNQDVYFKGLPYHTETYGDDSSPHASKPYMTEDDEYDLEILKTLPDGTSIKFVSKKVVRTRNYQRQDEFNEVARFFKYDEFGNRTEETKESRWHGDNGIVHVSILKKETHYAKNVSKWLVGLPCREVVRDGDGKLLSGKIVYYDGPNFIGLPAGEVAKGNMTRERHLALTEELANQVYGSVDMEPLGYIKATDPILGQGLYIDKVLQRHDARGNPVERRNGRAKTTTIKFDEHGIYPVEIISPHSLATKVEYEYKYGSVTAYTDFNGIRKEYLYDGAGRLVGIKRHDDPEGKPHIEFQYSAQDDPTTAYIVTLTREKSGGIQHKRITYLDAMGETLQVRSEAEEGKVVVSGARLYNSKGRLVGETKAYFASSIDMLDDVSPSEPFTEYRYDALGRSILRKDSAGSQFKTEYRLSSKWDYDPLDQLDEPGNSSFDTPKTEWYDSDEHLVAVVERSKDKVYVTRYTYDALGRRIKAETDGSVFVENVFDMLGRRIKSRYRDAGTFTYLYDATDNIVERKDGKGDVLYRKYDDLNRVIEARFGGPLGQLQESYTYDIGPAADHPKGHLVKVTGPFGEIKYSYTCCKNVKSKTRIFPGSAALTMQYESDILGRIQKVTYPDGFVVELGYNKGGLLESIKNIVKKISYGPTGKRTRIEYANGVVSELLYDSNMRLTGITTKSPDGAKKYQDLSYSYDPLGNITSILDGADVPGHIKNDRTFSYDELYQLVQDAGVDSSGDYDHNYIYDDKGNVKQYQEAFGNNKLLYENDEAPYQLTGIQGRADEFEYDGSGNLKNASGIQHIYDAKNRLIKTVQPDGTEVEHIYDYNSARVITKITKGANTQTTFNFDDVYFVTGTRKQKVIFDETGPVALLTNNNGADTGVIFHKDHLSSHTCQSNLTTGSYLGQESYYAFGMISFNNMVENPFHYNGKLYEEIPNLHFFGGRDYLPSYGRFLTPDPLFLEQQPEKFFRNPRSLRLYCYVANNPINIVDPDGLWFGIDDLIVAAVGFVVGVAAYLINAAVSGTDVHIGEMLMAGIAGAGIAWLTYNTLGLGAVIIVGAAQLAAPAVTGALDQASMGDSFGHRLLGFLSFAIKFAASPVTSTVGLLIGGFGTGFGLWGDVEWFKGGVIAFQYNPGSSGFSAVTLGATVNIWQGNTNNPLFAHELYHSRQYTYFGDTFIPLWLVGGVYGLISSAVAGNFQWSCFNSSNPSTAYGNPLEDGAHDAARGGGCT